MFQLSKTYSACPTEKYCETNCNNRTCSARYRLVFGLSALSSNRLFSPCDLVRFAMESAILSCRERLGTLFWLKGGRATGRAKSVAGFLAVGTTALVTVDAANLIEPDDPALVTLARRT